MKTRRQGRHQTIKRTEAEPRAWRRLDSLPRPLSRERGEPGPAHAGAIRNAFTVDVEDGIRGWRYPPTAGTGASGGSRWGCRGS